MTATIGKMLVKEGVITDNQLKEALDYQKAKGGRVGMALVDLGYITHEMLEQHFHWIPQLPSKPSQTGLSDNFLVDLLLKIAYFEGGVFSLQSIAATICLPINLVDTLVDLAKVENLVAVRSATGYYKATHIFELTGLGRQRSEEALKLSQYSGPAPVPLEQYRMIVAHQTMRQIELDEAWIREALKGLVIDDKLIRQLGPAFNSGRSIFLYGPPGTGKSSIAETMGRSIQSDVFVPYAVEVDGQVIKVFDPAIHVPTEVKAEAQTDIDLTVTHKFDLRWCRCHRPVVMVGGELTLDSLELDFDQTRMFYEAPIHMKASNGIFIIDDFGRQMIPPRQLLNRWIVPLERGTDFLALNTGQKFEIPFDQITVFATNLRPSELVDEAFLRRIRHKIKIDYQTEAQFKEILQRVCAQEDIAYNEDTAEYLIDHYYRKMNRPFVGSHPRDLLEQVVDSARFNKTKPEFSRQAIDLAAANYFVEME